MHHPTDRIIHTTTFVTPVMEHWLEREIVYREKYQAGFYVAVVVGFVLLFVCLFVCFYVSFGSMLVCVRVFFCFLICSFLFDFFWGVVVLFVCCIYV